MTSKQYLYDSLSERSLDIIEYILDGYFNEKIDLIKPTFEDGEPNFDGEFNLAINDNTYKENGYEILVLKWVENCEDIEYIINCFCIDELNNKLPRI